MANRMIGNLKEMTERYRGSHISRIDGKTGERVPLLVNKFHREGDIVYVTDNEEGKAYPEKEICLDRPKLGAFNIGKYVIHITTVPRRQWKRGFNYGEIKITNKFEYEGKVAGHRAVARSTILKAIYKSEYPSVEEALKEVRGFRALARAFSPKFYFGIKNKGSNVLVFYKKWIVGYMKDDDSSTVMLKSHHLYEELSQFIKVEKV